jgi:hypothetical protein
VGDDGGLAVDQTTRLTTWPRPLVLSGWLPVGFDALDDVLELLDAWVCGCLFWTWALVSIGETGPWPTLEMLMMDSPSRPGGEMRLCRE